jgi:transcriptional regulator with XRE-family HTH domain
MATNSRDKSNYSLTVADQVRAERAAARLSQAEVMRKAEIKRSTYIRIEKGTHIADITELDKIMRALGLSMPEFFRRVDNRMTLANRRL